MQSWPLKAYMDATLVPVLMQGLLLVAKERPARPIEFLAAFLFKNKDKCDPVAMMRLRSSQQGMNEGGNLANQLE